MGLPHATAGEVIKLIPPDLNLEEAKTTAIVKTKEFETIRLCVHAGQVIPPHKTKGPITVQCLKGRAIFNIGQNKNELQPGDWLYLGPNEVHSLEGLEDSALLLTIIFIPSD
ncbi:MAG: cupin domain-containing protein [Deltaproteobacteria bacterium]|nr:cupin domain-containing protein [Deltaproteobacteria bacterium]